MHNINDEIVLQVSLLVMIVVVMLAIGYSPLLAYGLSLILLALGVGSNTIYIRLYLSFSAIFSSAVMVASRTYNIGANNDDFSNYYFPRYIDIGYGSTIFDPAFAGGVEFLLPLTFKIISFVTNGSQSAPLLLFINTFFSQLILYFWLEKFGLKVIDKNKKSLCIAFTLIFFSIMMPVQFFRQVYSSLFVLFALSYFFNAKYMISLFFIFIATLFHTSALFVFLIFYLMMSENKRNHYFVIGLSILLTLFTIPLMFIISKYNLLGAATYKIYFYLNGGIDTLVGGLGKLKFIFLMFILQYFLFKNCENFSKYKNLMIVAGISYSFLIFIPVLPERLMNLYIAILFGYLMFLATYRADYYIRILLCFFIIYKMFNYCYDYDYTNMLLFSYSGLWYSYSWYGDDFFYYFDLIF